MIVNYFKIIYTIFSSVFLIQITEEIYMERLLTTEEVAELLRIDPVTVRRLIMRRGLNAYRIAGEFRFTTENREKSLESQRVVENMGLKNDFGDKFPGRARKVLSRANEEARHYNH